jgi:hypothetical protein
MSRMGMTTALFVAPVLLAGCAQPGFRPRTSWFDERKEWLKDRAAFDLDCPAGQLKTQELGNERTVGVTGCGRRATYLYQRGQDAWVMNGAVETNEPTSAAPGSTTSLPSALPSAIREDKTGSSGGMTTP